MTTLRMAGMTGEVQVQDTPLHHKKFTHGTSWGVQLARVPSFHG